MDESTPLVPETDPCHVCFGSGIIEVPSMLGYGTEIYPCGVCHHFSDEVAKAMLDEVHAQIMRNIR